VVLPPPTPVVTPSPVPTRPTRRWPLVLALLLLGALAGGILAFALTRGGGEPTATPTRVRTVVKTVQGKATTITQQVTTTASPPPSPSPPPPPPPASPPPAAGSRSGAALTDAGLAKMKAGDWQGALPLLEQAVSKLQGTGQIYEAYADYNLASTLLNLGRCDRVKDLLKNSERIQGHRSEIDTAKAQEKSQCRGGGD
jgi:hypothetical protein